MKILIDARVLDHTNAGIAAVLRELLPFFRSVSKDIGILHKNPEANVFYSNLGYKWVHCEYSLTDNIIKSIVETQNIIKTGEWDVFYSPIWFPRLFYKNKRIRLIVTMHDLIYLEESKSLSRYLRSYLVTLFGGLLSEKIITVSEHSRAKILKKYPFFKDKICVCSDPIPLSKLQSYDYNIINKIKVTPRKFFLFVSAMREYKGFSQTIEAFIRMPITGYQLVLVGKPDVGDLVGTLEYREDVIFTGYVSDAELNSLYRKAFALVFPSRSEGFGLPILEAQYHGCPVIATDLPVLVETAGDGAIFVKDQSPKNISQAMETIIKNNFLREDLIKKGEKNYKRFLPKKVCKNTVTEIVRK